MIQKKTIVHFLLVCVLMLLIVSCRKNKEDQMSETQMIASFFQQNPALIFELKPSGLYYLDLQAGTGLVPATHDTAYIFYSVKFLDGRGIETNFNSTDTLIMPVNEGKMITGFDEGITYMREGGRSLLVIPSALAYGRTGDAYGIIPPDTPLLFEISLVKVKPGSGKK